MKKQNTGITLIALVITIIVLLILAGVTIATLTGENGILTQATNAKEKNNSARAEEEVALALSNLKIEESIKDMTQSEKTAFLKKELESFKSGESVEVNLSKNGGSINHRGLGFEVDENYVLKQNATLNKSDWDRKAAPTDCFIWLSDDPNSSDYGTVIGYTSKASSYVTLRYPTRCKRIEFTYNEQRYNNALVTYEASRNYVLNVKEVELPETVTSIESSAFKAEGAEAYFGTLEKITVTSGNQHYSSLNGILYNKDQTMIIQLPAKLDEDMLPEGLEILQSDHPYSDNMSTYYTKTIEGARELNLLFSSQSHLEDSWDYVEIYDGNDNMIYTSRDRGRSELSGKNITVSGDTVKIKLITDGSVTYWGFMCVVQGVN